MPSDHPTIRQFLSKLGKRELTQIDAKGFDKWRNGSKCNTPELKKEADDAWEVFQSKGGFEHILRPQPTKNIATASASGKGGGRPQTRAETSNRDAAGPESLGEPFHNPYTFLPFPPKNWFEGPRKRRFPTPLSMDEKEPDRFTGVLDITIRTLTPLLTCEAFPEDANAPHKTYRSLAIGQDVIVPATGVRGSLRNLMSLLAGGTLAYLDDCSWLVQGRDLNLGPRGKSSPPETPSQCFLAEVVTPGTETREGELSLGETQTVSLKHLERAFERAGKRIERPQAGRKIVHFWLDDECESVKTESTERHQWKLKLSGRPINLKGKREGLFRKNGKTIRVRPELWQAYLGRNRHADRYELRTGDLVWLEPISPELTEIKSDADIASIQWARWGRQGERLLDLIRNHHPHMLPDSMNPDGLVDEVTDLFGQIPSALVDDGPAGPFAARVRPENLVFSNALNGGIHKKVTIAPLAPPHPGCSAFYREDQDADTVSNRGKLRGAKVYRTTAERGEHEPWRFSTQGVYGETGAIQNSMQKVNKTCDLLKEGMDGKLRIACRSLSRRELALLLLACGVDWRLGGGKPLGLGHCRPVRIIVRDEFGAETLRLERKHDDPLPVTLPSEYEESVRDLLDRRNLWCAVMRPVEKLRYPRAANANNNRIQRGGHLWFQRHASPRKGSDGLEVLWIDGNLKKCVGNGMTRMRAQVLPAFDPQCPGSDCLYGYDLFAGEGGEWKWQASNRQTYFNKLEPFDPAKHATGRERSGGFHGQNEKSRSRDREERKNNSA